ncbi:MAG TPA: hypothetical protein VMD91_09600 [Candidatus Sulfotelmatobacter sp.]|nr:hypothetical protein [Candidatus Sulfotelmatobacter sp.]
MRILGLFSVIGVALAAPFLLSTAQASAAACKDVPTIIHSADLANNTADGGHVKQHVLGETPPVGTSQAGKTLFADKAKYAAAWRQYTYYGTAQCAGGSEGKVANQTMTLDQLHMGHLDAYSCTAANPNGTCSAKTLYMAHSITYGFKFTGGKWILNTCYPIPAT